MEPNTKKALERVPNWDVEVLERKGMDFNFTDIIPLVERIQKLLLNYSKNPEFETYLPANKYGNIQNQIQQIVNLVDQIGKFDPKSSQNPNQDRNSLATSFKNSYGELAPEFIFPFELYLLKKEVSASEALKKTEIAANLVEEIKQNQAEAKNIIEGMREASLKAGTSKFSSIFESQALKNRNTALAWLLFTIVFGVGIGYFVWKYFINYYYGIQDQIDLRISIPIIISKFVFVSLMTAFFFQFVKNFNSNMHLFVINRHKANCLNTFQAMVESSDDSRTREAVLLQASKAIFELSETGFVSNSDREITGLETIRVIDQLKQS